MKKITIQLKTGETMKEKIQTEMSKIKSKGFTISAAGYDWFMYDENKNNTNK